MAVLLKTAKAVKGLMCDCRPVLAKVLYYGKAELLPPKISEISTVKKNVLQMINSAKTGKWKEITVREAWMNTLIATEVLCWFFVGECIGKQHIVGYKV